MQTEGYVYCPNLASRERLRRLYDEIVDICLDAGWLLRERDGQMITNPAAKPNWPDPSFFQVYERVISLEAFNGLPHSLELAGIAAAILGDEDVFLRPNAFARLVLPRAVDPAPAHQDFPHEQGAVEAYTVWVALCDIPRSLGGLALVPRSHRQGVLEHRFSLGSGGMSVPDPAPSPLAWATTDFAMGDAVIFHSLTLHKGMPNTTEDRLRISADFRYQRMVDPITPHMLRPSGGRLTWPEVYANWTGHDHRNYWKDRHPPIVNFDYAPYDARDKDAIARALAGDPDARRFLPSIPSRTQNEAIRRAALSALSALEAREPCHVIRR